MKRKTVLVLAAFSLLLLACDITSAASTREENVRALVFLDTLKGTVETGMVVRESLDETLNDFLAGRVGRSVLVKKARSVRDWHQKALKEVEAATRVAPAEFRRMGQLYSDFLRDYAEAVDLLADGAENVDTSLLEYGLTKLKKARASRDAFLRELETSYERYKRR